MRIKSSAHMGTDMGTNMVGQKLSDRKLKSSLSAGRYYDGGGTGLHFHVRDSGSKAWVQRLRLNGKYVDLGLGNYPAISLSNARKIALENKSLAAEGKDPRLVKAKPKKVPTFNEVADTVVAMKVKELSNAKHQAQWASTLATYAKPILGDLPINQIEVEHILAVLTPIWSVKHETASRVRGRMEVVFDYAIARKLRPAPNPATWKGNLAALLPSKISSSAAKHQPALHVADAKRWWNELSLRDGMGTKALQFLALTASRSGEVRGMNWSEIHKTNGDDEKQVWIIPKARMKARREHRVPLTPMMVEILASLPQHSKSDLVFHSDKGSQLSDMTLSATMKRIHQADVENIGIGFIDITSKKRAVPHGIRSTFRNWAAEEGYESDMAEIQLAHEIGTAVTRAYLRTDMMEKRRKMMVVWGDFLKGT
jgi:integrase